MRQIEDCSLYAFIDGAYLNGRDPADITKALIEGGADIIQLRLKHASIADATRIAEQVLPVTRAAGIPLVINDYIEVALQIKPEYLHLGQEDFFESPYKNVNEIPGTNSIRIGLSSHTPEQALKALAAGAAYLGVGPVFPTQTKPQAKPVTLDYVQWAAKHIRIPWFAIGGINLSNLDHVLAAGAKRICVVSDILNAHNIAKQCHLYRTRLDSFRSTSLHP